MANDTQSPEADTDETPGRYRQEIAAAVKSRRRLEGWSIERLSAASGVSRSTISKIERAETTPSTTVLTKLSDALGMTLTELVSLHDEDDVVLLKAEDQPLLLDPRSGLVRRCLSPILPGRGIDWVLNKLPAGALSTRFQGHRRGTEEYVYVLSGVLLVMVGDVRHVLEAGDSIFYKATAEHRFHNVGDVECEYFVIIDSSKWRR